MRRLVLLGPVLVALVAAGCSSKAAGTAVPPPNAGNGERPPASQLPPDTSTTSSKPGTGTSPLANTDPCTLLTTEMKAQLGLSGDGQNEDIGAGRTCTWRLRGSEDTYFFTVGIDDTLGLHQIPDTANPKSLPDIGKHKAVQTSGGGGQGSCSVLMGVTDSSRVVTQVVAGTDAQKSCDLAMQMARLVEPKLP